MTQEKAKKIRGRRRMIGLDGRRHDEMEEEGKYKEKREELWKRKGSKGKRKEQDEKEKRTRYEYASLSEERKM